VEHAWEVLLSSGRSIVAGSLGVPVTQAKSTWSPGFRPLQRPTETPVIAVIGV
jgi:hypothetical protein